MPELSRSLQPRHITMVSIGNMIGAGLFFGSSAAIAAAAFLVVDARRRARGPRLAPAGPRVEGR